MLKKIQTGYLQDITISFEFLLLTIAFQVSISGFFHNLALLSQNRNKKIKIKKKLK